MSLLPFDQREGHIWMDGQMVAWVINRFLTRYHQLKRTGPEQLRTEREQLFSFSWQLQMADELSQEYQQLFKETMKTFAIEENFVP